MASFVGSLRRIRGPVGERAHRASAPGEITPRLRMSHISSALTPSNAAITGSGSDDRAHASSNRAGRLLGIRCSRSLRIASSACRCAMSLAACSAPALTATRQELAASSSALTHCVITERIYVSYSSDASEGRRAITERSASSCASAYPSKTSVSL